MAFNIVATPTNNSEALSETRRDMAIASDGKLWVNYQKTIVGVTNVYVAYSSDNGATWTEELAAASCGCECMAIDSADNIHLIYNGKGRAPFPLRNGIFYKERLAGVWQPEETIALIDVPIPLPVPNGQQMGTMSIDSVDRPQVVWSGFGWGLNPGVPNLQYRYKDAGVWQAQIPITDLGTRQMEPAIAIDSADNLHITWVSCLAPLGTIGNIKYAQPFLILEAVTATAKSVQPNIVIDSHDVPHIAWWENTLPFNEIQYSNRTGGTWSAPVVVNDTSTGEISIDPGPALSLDISDNVYIAWSQDDFPIDAYIWYNRKVGGIWQGSQGVNLTQPDAASGYESPAFLWAMWPRIGGVRTNITNDQYLVYQSRTETVWETFLSPPAPPTFIITATAGAGGTITPSGAVIVVSGANQNFIIASNPRYLISDVLVDGVSIGPVSSYTFVAVVADHTISANFVELRNMAYVLSRTEIVSPPSPI